MTEEKSPLFGSWNRFYAVVLGWLVLLIVAFYLFTLFFS